jgi:hypothetical protein
VFEHFLQVSVQSVNGAGTVTHPRTVVHSMEGSYPYICYRQVEVSANNFGDSRSKQFSPKVSYA